MYIKENTKEKIKSSACAARIAEVILKERPAEEQHKEYFYIIGLNSKNSVLVIDLISIGTINQGAVYIREVVKTAINKNCVGIIAFHNHPSGDPSPSVEDGAVTSKIKEALALLDIKLLDHIIIGDNNYYSFADENRL